MVKSCGALILNIYIKKLNEEKLDNIPFHSNVNQLVRLVAKDIPFHVAVHQIKCANDFPSEYVKPHKHDSDELNLILAENGNELTYSIEIDGNVSEVKSPSFIWIPKGKLHSANVIKGSGTFVCIILQEEYRAYD